MARRVDVDASLPPLVLPGRILNELCAHALETLPEECCGLILGQRSARFAQLVRCRNEMTRRHLADPQSHPRDGSTAFWMNEADYAHAQTLAEAAGDEVTAVYHSHVDAGAYLSELDLEYAEQRALPVPERGPDRDRRARAARGRGRPVPARGHGKAVRGTLDRVGGALMRALAGGIVALLARGVQHAGRSRQRAPRVADRGRLSHARGFATARVDARGPGRSASRRRSRSKPAPAGEEGVARVKDIASYLKTVTTGVASGPANRRFPGRLGWLQPRTSAHRSRCGSLGRGHAASLVRRPLAAALHRAGREVRAGLRARREIGRGPPDHAWPRGAPGRLLRTGRQLRADERAGRERRPWSRRSRSSSRTAPAPCRSRRVRATMRPPAPRTAARSST